LQTYVKNHAVSIAVSINRSFKEKMTLFSDASQAIQFDHLVVIADTLDAGSR
jgi:hypothetical protein